ncbi:MAG: TIGR01906 family membrane protein [Lactobacillus sp.]|jgi:integral membrane protein (TIGR01906 family)
MRKNPVVITIYNFLLAVASGVVGALLASGPLLAVFVKLQKTDAIVHEPLGVIMHNYWQLLGYLLSPFDNVLHMSNFPTSSNAAEHFYECKLLFMLALVVFLIGLVLSFYARWRKQKHFMNLNRSIALTLMLIPVIILPFAAVDFDEFFVIFHHIFFHNANWLFDPATDPIINVLTEGFFAACFAVFGIIYELYFARFLLKK